ncbi:hypothetical protein [Serratia marcescens]|uniref:hypothetical protein n=1 Tax=Serratia marcescens TaxID=615 RepID=UPI001BAEC295|nr:hypothetical protein [Serratia marcescens]MBS3894927.1 hypothetical protein [Serratia marcescens]
MFIPRRIVMIISTAMPFCVHAAPTTELPPAPSAYAYIVVKYPAAPIPLPKKKKMKKKSHHLHIPPPVITIVSPPPALPSNTRDRSPFSVDRDKSP